MTIRQHFQLFSVLADHPDNPWRISRGYSREEACDALCPEFHEVWQWMGDCFRHRHHPATGARLYLPASLPESWGGEVPVGAEMERSVV